MSEFIKVCEKVGIIQEKFLKKAKERLEMHPEQLAKAPLENFVPSYQQDGTK